MRSRSLFRRLRCPPCPPAEIPVNGVTIDGTSAGLRGIPSLAIRGHLHLCRAGRGRRGRQKRRRRFSQSTKGRHQLHADRCAHDQLTPRHEWNREWKCPGHAGGAEILDDGGACARAAPGRVWAPAGPGSARADFPARVPARARRPVGGAHRLPLGWTTAGPVRCRVPRGRGPQRSRQASAASGCQCASLEMADAMSTHSGNDGGLAERLATNALRAFALLRLEPGLRPPASGPEPAAAAAPALLAGVIPAHFPQAAWSKSSGRWMDTPTPFSGPLARRPAPAMPWPGRRGIRCGPRAPASSGWCRSRRRPEKQHRRSLRRGWVGCGSRSGFRRDRGGRRLRR